MTSEDRNSEVNRFLDACPRLKTPEVDRNNRTKYDSLERMLNNGESIVSTHALFKNIKRLTHLLSDYVVVIDEMIDVIHTYDVNKDFNFIWDLMVNENMVFKHDDGRIEVEIDNYILNDIEDGAPIKKFLTEAINYDMYSTSKTHYVCRAPVELFTLSKETRILTFLFSGSTLQGFFNITDIEYEHITDDKELEEWKETARANLILLKPKKHFNCNTSNIEIETNITHCSTNRIAIAKQLKSLRRRKFKTPADEILICASKNGWGETRTNKISTNSLMSYNTGLNRAQ